MKRNLLSSAIIIALMTLGATGCDDNNAKTEATPTASSQPATPAPSPAPATHPVESPAQPPEAKPETPAQPEADAEEVYDEKMDVYIDCFNKLQLPVQRSLARYADWVKDFKKGPTGKESLVYGIYGITESYITNCQKEMKQVAVLTPLLEPIDSVAVSYIDSAVALGNTINEMEKYYTQENYKDDAFAKGKALHQTLLKNLEDFKPVSEKYHAAIQEINDKRQLTQLKNIEETEGKTFNYYSLAVMISAKQINKVISADTFDAEAMMKKVAELETLIAQLKQSDTDGRNFPFVNSATDYQLKAKKYIRRIRDNVPYSDFEKQRVQDPTTGWMVSDSYPAALRSYNEMVDDYNRLR
ncbi:TPA: YiiG family protein [Salmonella enterica]|nr:YiiG family protein [Salmonella enterica]